MKKVAHLTSVHTSQDARIFYKECLSLKSAGYSVSLVAPNEVDEEIEGIQIYAIKKPKGKLRRFFSGSLQVYKKAIEIDANIYHFHDPELIFVGLMLKRRGKKVIYDIHEDISKQILCRDWIPVWMRKSLSSIFIKFERYVCVKFDYLIVPQPLMKIEYQKINKKCELIANFVSYKKEEFTPVLDQHKILYVGSITRSRGVFNMLDLIEKLGSNYKLTLVGRFEYDEVYTEAKKHPGWKQVDFKGWVGHDDISEIYKEHSVGIILLNNVGQYYLAYSLKLFEYMAYGLTVIMPDFGEWVGFNKEANSGYNVNVSDGASIASIIEQLDKKKLSNFHYNNIGAISTKYSWNSEEKKLIHIYEELE